MRQIDIMLEDSTVIGRAASFKMDPLAGIITYEDAELTPSCVDALHDLDLAPPPDCGGERLDVIIVPSVLEVGLAFEGGTQIKVPMIPLQMRTL